MKIYQLYKKANISLRITPFIADELSIEFENYKEHYEENDSNILLEKNIYEKLISNNFNFSNEEIIIIGQTLIEIEDKDVFSRISGKRQLLDVEIQIGMLIPIGEEEIKMRIKNGFGINMKQFPKINGQFYEYDSNWGAKYS